MFDQGNIFEVSTARKYRCIICGYVYSPLEHNNVDFMTLPSGWVCPECGVGKDKFTQL